MVFSLSKLRKYAFAPITLLSSFARAERDQLQQYEGLKQGLHRVGTPRQSHSQGKSHGLAKPPCGLDLEVLMGTYAHDSATEYSTDS